MAQPPGSGRARRVMQDAGVRTWAKYLDKERTGEIWNGACEVGKWAHQIGSKIAIYGEWGAKGLYRKMAEVGEGGRAAEALLSSRQGGAHYELLLPPEGEKEKEEGEGDKRETTGMEAVAMEVESVTGGELAEDQETRGRPGGQDEERVWQEVQQVQIQGGGTGWQYQGHASPVRERREVGKGSARDRRQRPGWEGVVGVQMQKLEYEEVPEGAGKCDWNRRQETAVGLWVTGGGEGVLQLQRTEDLGARWRTERAVQLQ